MLNSFILTLPCSIGIILMLIFAFLGKETKYQKSIMLMLAIASVYFFTDACFSSADADYHTLVYTSLLGQLVTPCLIPLIMLYMMNLQGLKPPSSVSAFWIIAPVFLFSCAVMIHILVGTDNEVLYLAVDDGTLNVDLSDDRMFRLSKLFKVFLFRFVLILEALMLIFYLVKSAYRRNLSFKKVNNFLKSRNAISPFDLQHILISTTMVVIIVKIVLKRSFLLQNQWAAIIIALLFSGLLLLIGIVSFFSSWKKLTLSDMKVNQPISYDEDLKEYLNALKEKEGLLTKEDQGSNPAEVYPTEKDGTVDQIPIQNASLQNTTSDPELETGPSSKESIEETEKFQVKQPVVPEMGAAAAGQETNVNTVLLGKFEDLIINRQMFLTPGITINEIAAKLGTNRTYISQLVNDYYHMPFPELLNNLRIDYAEQYILHNRDAKQNEVAQACGFPSASSFNVTFKKVTGITPRIWLATYDNTNE